MRSRRLVIPYFCTLFTAAACGWAGPAAAQKEPGTTLAPPSGARSSTPALSPVPSAPAPAPAPVYAPPARLNAPAAAGGERDSEARQLADQLPLDPATANLQGRMPTDVPGTTSRLGLRVPNGTAVDLRNRPTTREAVIDALRH